MSEGSRVCVLLAPGFEEIEAITVIDVLRRAEVDTTVRRRASTGVSHSKVTPTTSSPAPSANRISVVEGSTETMRTTPSLGWPP